MIAAAGAELAAVGQVLREAAKVASPAVSRIRADNDRRADAYNDLQRAAVELLVRLDTMVAIQEAVQPNRRVVSTAATVAGARAIDDAGAGFTRTLATATRSLSLVLLLREMVFRFDAERAVRTEMVTFNASVARVLSGLTEVRLVGGHDAQAAAENLVAVIGEAISETPIIKERWLTRTRPEIERYNHVRSAAMYHLRCFGAVARQDLNGLWWRRRARRSRWQFYRPKPPEIRAIDLDLKKLIDRAFEAD